MNKPKAISVARIHTETYDRTVDVVYVERSSDEYRFLIRSTPGQYTPEGARMGKVWLTETELDDLIIGLVQAKLEHGHE